MQFVVMFGWLVMLIATATSYARRRLHVRHCVAQSRSWLRHR